MHCTGPSAIRSWLKPCRYERRPRLSHHILERIERLGLIRDEGKKAFTESFVLQDAAIRSFEVMGETIKQLSPGLRARHPEVPWKQIAGFRDVLIHNYLGINLRTSGTP